MSRIAFSIGIVFGALNGCIRVDTTVQPTAADSAQIVFDVPIPEEPDNLALYTLERPEVTRPLTDLVKNACVDKPDDPSLSSGTSLQTFRAIAESSQRCRFDESGEIELYPSFETLHATLLPGSVDQKTRFEHGKKFLENDGWIPQDDTSMEVDSARLLSHVRVMRGPNSKASSVVDPIPFLMYVSARRVVDGFRVDGPGSRAAVMVSAAAKTAGFTLGWKRATRATKVDAPEVQHVRADIERQLMALGSRLPVHVQRIDVAYYDGNGSLLQPVYRFIAELGRERGSIGGVEHIVGYVPFVPTQDPVPRLGKEFLRDPPETSAASTADPATEKTPAEPRDGGAPAPPALTEPAANAPEQSAGVKVGRYVARYDSKGWIGDARQFWQSLKSVPRADLFIDNYLTPAHPDQFTVHSSADFINNVDIALVEAHGAPWQFATKRNCCDSVYIGGLGFPENGYGARSGGRLKHWILHSCDVVQSPKETEIWADPWWRVFNGLYSVVGYRSAMYINDGAGGALGRRLGKGEPVISAWFSAVASLNVYGIDPSVRAGCRGERPMGRPAAISACGAEKAAAGDTVRIKPDCLDAWWIEDEIVRP